MKTQERHPFPANFKQITSFIDYEIKNTKYNKIFLVTEELNYIEKLKSKYKDKICYNSSYRSNHPDIFKNHRRKNHRYLIGKENEVLAKIKKSVNVEEILEQTELTEEDKKALNNE